MIGLVEEKHDTDEMNEPKKLFCQAELGNKTRHMKIKITMNRSLINAIITEHKNSLSDWMEEEKTRNLLPFLESRRSSRRPSKICRQIYRFSSVNTTVFNSRI